MVIGMVAVGPITVHAVAAYRSHSNSTNLDNNNADVAAFIDETGVDMRDWDQRDYRWNYYALGISGNCNIGHAGCTCTSITKLMIESGLATPTELNPGKLIRWMNRNEGFSGSNILWGTPEKFANEVLGKQWWYRSGDVFKSTSGANSDYTLLNGKSPLFDGSYTYNDDLLGYMFRYSGTGYHQIIAYDSTGYSLAYQDVRLSMLLQAGYHLVLNVHNDGAHWVAIDETATRASGTTNTAITINGTDYSIPVYNTFYVMNSWYGSSGDGTNSRDTLNGYLNARSDDSNRGRFVRAAAYSTNPAVMYTLSAEEKAKVTSQYSTDHYALDTTPAESNNYKEWSDKDYRWACGITSYPTVSISGNASANTDSKPSVYGATDNADSLIELMGEWGQSIVCLDKAMIQAGIVDANYYPALNDSYRARTETYLTDRGQTGNLLGDLNDKGLISETGGVISWNDLSTLNDQIIESGTAYTNASVSAGSAVSTAMIDNMRVNGYHYVVNLEKGSTADNAWAAVDEERTLDSSNTAGDIYILGCTSDTSTNAVGTTLASASTTLTGSANAYKIYYIKTDVNADKFLLTYSGNGATVTATDGTNAIASGTYVNKGTNVTFTAFSPETGRTIEIGSWSINNSDSEITSATMSTLFSTTTAQNVVYTAGYSDYTVTHSGSNYTLTGTTTYHYGDAATVTITPDSGYSVSSVTAAADGNAVAVTKSGTNYSFTMPASNVALTITTTENTTDYRRIIDSNDADNTKSVAVTKAMIEAGAITISDGLIDTNSFADSDGSTGWSALTAYSGVDNAIRYGSLKTFTTPANTTFTGSRNYYTEVNDYGSHIVINAGAAGWYCIDRDKTLATGEFYVMVNGETDNSVLLSSVVNTSTPYNVFTIEERTAGGLNYLSNYRTLTYSGTNSTIDSAVFTYTENNSTISGTVTSGGYLKNGATVDLTAAPNTGYEATASSDWSIGGIDGTHASVTMGDSNLTVTHTAEAKAHSVTFAGSNYTIGSLSNITESSGSYSFTYNGSGNCSFAVTPSAGYIITSVTATGATLTSTPSVSGDSFIITYSFLRATDSDVTVTVETAEVTDYRGWNGTESFYNSLAQVLTEIGAGGKTIWTYDDAVMIAGLAGISNTDTTSSSWKYFKNNFSEVYENFFVEGTPTAEGLYNFIKDRGSHVLITLGSNSGDWYCVDQAATLAFGEVYVKYHNGSSDYNIISLTDLLAETGSSLYKAHRFDEAASGANWINSQTSYYPVTYSTDETKALIGGDFIYEDTARHSSIGGDFTSGGYLPADSYAKITGTPKNGYEPAAEKWTDVTTHATSGAAGVYTYSFRSITGACAATYNVSPLSYSIIYPSDAPNTEYPSQGEGFYYVSNPSSADYTSTVTFKIALFDGYSIGDVTASYGDARTALDVTKSSTTESGTYSVYDTTVYTYTMTMPADDVTVSFAVTDNNTTKTIHLETDTTSYSGGTDNYEDGKPVWYIWTFDDPTNVGDETYGRWIKGVSETSPADWTFDNVGKYFRIYRYSSGSDLDANGVPTGTLWNYTHTTIASSGGDVYKFTAFNRGVDNDIFGKWIGNNIYLYPKAWEISNETTECPGYRAWTWGEGITDKWVTGVLDEETGCYQFVGIGEHVAFCRTGEDAWSGWQTHNLTVDVKNSGELYVLNDRYSDDSGNKIDGYWAQYEDFADNKDFTTWTKDNARWSGVRLGSSGTATDTVENWTLASALAKLIVQAGNQNAPDWDVTNAAYKLFNSSGVFLFSNESIREETGFTYYRYNDSSKSTADWSTYGVGTSTAITINYGSGKDSSGTYSMTLNNSVSKDSYPKYNYAMLINGYHFILRIDHTGGGIQEYVTVDEATSLVSGEFYVWRSVDDEFDDDLTPSANGSYNLLDLMKAINGGVADTTVDETKMFGMSDKSGNIAEYDYRYWSRYDNRWRTIKMGDYDHESPDRMSFWGALVASYTKMMKQCGIKGWKYTGTGTTQDDFLNTANWEESYDYTIYDVLMYMKYITKGFNDSDQNSIVWSEINGAFGKEGTFEWATSYYSGGVQTADNNVNYFYMKDENGDFVQYEGKEVNFPDKFDTSLDYTQGYSYTAYKDMLMALIKDGYHLLIRANTHESNDPNTNLGTWVPVEEKLSINSGTIYIMNSDREISENLKTLESFLNEAGTGRNGKFIRVAAYKGGSTYIKTGGDEDKPQDEVVEIEPEVNDDVDAVTNTALVPYSKDPAYCGANAASGYYSYVYGTTAGDVTLKFSGAILGKTYRFALFDDKDKMLEAIKVFNAGLDYKGVTYTDAVSSAANTVGGLMSINIFDAVGTNNPDYRSETQTKYIIVQLVEPDTDENKVKSKSNVIWTTMNYQVRQLTTGFDRDRTIEVKQSDLRNVTVGGVTQKGIDLSEYLNTQVGGTAYSNTASSDTYISRYTLSYTYYETDTYSGVGAITTVADQNYFIPSAPGTYTVTLTAVGDVLTNESYCYPDTGVYADTRSRIGLSEKDKLAPKSEAAYVNLGTYRTITVKVQGEVDYTYVDNNGDIQTFRTEDVDKHGIVESEWDIPKKDGYIFTGWYDTGDKALIYGAEVADAERGVNSINNIVDAVTTVHAGWVKVDDINKDATDTNVLPAEYDGKYKGFDLPGVQIRAENMLNPNVSETEKQPGGLRFITSLNNTMWTQLNTACTNVEYGYVVAKATPNSTTAKWIDYHREAHNKLLYKSTTANGIDTTKTTTVKDHYFNFVTNVDCTANATRRDHKSFTDYRLYSMVITYQNADESAKTIPVIARPYIRYIDANGLERVTYNDYGGNAVCGGCSASYSVVAAISETAIK